VSSIGKNVGTFRDPIDGIDRSDPLETAAQRGDARRANDDVAVCPGSAETKSTGCRTGTTERTGENGDGDDGGDDDDNDDGGGGGCDSQRRCVREP